MSMILDALARAERERHKGTESAQTDFILRQQSVEKKQKLVMWIVGALLVNALVIGALLVARPWQTPVAELGPDPVDSSSNSRLSQDQTGVEEHASPLPAGTPPVSSPPSGSDTGVTINLQADAVISAAPRVEDLASQASASSKTVFAVPPKIVKKPPVSYADTAIKAVVSEERSQSVQPLSSTDTARQSGVIRLNDLPSQEKAQFSRYEVNVHVFDANPDKSFVLINMTRLRNGDRIPGGPQVDQITTDGVILVQGGKRVLIERN